MAGVDTLTDAANGEDAISDSDFLIGLGLSNSLLMRLEMEGSLTPTRIRCIVEEGQELPISNTMMGPDNTKVVNDAMQTYKDRAGSLAA